MRLVKKIMTFAFAVAAMSGLAFGTAVYAGARAQQSMSNSVTFRQADRNGDGFVDAQEVAKVPGMSIGKADSNYDGLISKSEWVSAGGKTVARNDHYIPDTKMTFSQADRNGDGFVDAQEVAKVPGMSIGKADSNYDGLISKSEWASAGGKIKKG